MADTTLGKYLKNLRKSRNYTQEFVASYLCISRQAYSHYETGRAVPTNDTCYKIANLYSIHPNKIIELSLQPVNLADASISDNSPNDFDDFLEYSSEQENYKKLRYLNHKEKELIYYFNNISTYDQEEILEILKIKLKRNHRK